MNEIQKPTTMLRAEFIQSLADLINNSSLPAFIIEPILKDFYNNIVSIGQKQLESDIAAYNKTISELKNSERDKEPEDSKESE